jgi:hypothetical protein
VLFVAAEPAHHAPPTAAIVVGSVLVLAMLLVVALNARSAWRDRRGLKVCPRCGAGAVRRVRCEPLAPRLTRVAIECGQCAAWRQVAVENDVWHGHRRRLARDRRRMARRARRAETARSVAECRIFTALLHAEIAGPEDFLARTRPPVSARRRSPGTDEERTSP